MSARENIGYAATDTDRIDELAALLEIGDVLDRRPPKLSGGEQQRVALARTLAADPDALLLDEPLSSLDAPIRRRLRTDLHTLFASLDIPVVYVTHDQRTATALGDRLAIVRDGAIEQVGPPSAVLDRPANRFVAQFTGTENVFEVTVEADGETVSIGDQRLHTDADAVAGGQATLCLHPSHIDVRKMGESHTPNTLSGTVTHWLNEGDAYRVAVDIDGVADPLVVSVPPVAFEEMSLDTGQRVRVEVPSTAVHLLP